MKFGLLTYTKSRNFGDQVQSIAARRYLPDEIFYLDRDHLTDYTDEKSIKLIMNGWFMAKPENWPPPQSIIPLLVSFHITHDYNANNLLFSKKSIEFFQRNEPVGCRDYFTVKLLESHGIKAYYSGCLTLTLQRELFASVRTEDIYIVDVLYKVGSRSHDWFGKFKRKWLLKQIIPESVLNKARYMSQVVAKHTSEENKLKIAEDALKKYASAKLVITSRIHCALPCIAFGTPVIFIDGALEEATDTTRLRGITEYMNSYSIKNIIDKYRGFIPEFLSGSNFTNPLGIDWDNPPSNPNNHLKVANSLIEKCKKFVSDINS